MSDFKVRKVSAILAVLVVVAEVGSSVMLGSPLRGSAVIELVAGAVILLLPAGLLLTGLAFGRCIEKASPVYTIALLGGIWFARSLSDALAYAIVVGLYLAPLVTAYTVALIASSLILRRKSRSQARRKQP